MTPQPLPPTPEGPATKPPWLSSWPQSAQLAAAYFVGIATTLLILAAWNTGRWATAPTRFESEEQRLRRLDLNRADRLELAVLPGVGERLAERIVVRRTQDGPFRRIDDLVEVPGVGPSLIARLRPLVTVGVDQSFDAEPPAQRKRRTTEPSSKTKTTGLDPDRPLDPNTASATQLQQLPGIGPKLSQRIIDERAKQPFLTVEELRRVSGIGAKILDRLRPFVHVGAAENVAALEQH